MSKTSCPALGIWCVSRGPGLDDATEADIALRSWKAAWPHYVRVHHGRFVAGSLANGVSLDELIAMLGVNAFAPTKRNVARGSGNTDPRRVYLRKPAIELTPEAAAWLEEQLGVAFACCGMLTPTEMQGLDLPERPAHVTGGATS